MFEVCLLFLIIKLIAKVVNASHRNTKDMAAKAYSRSPDGLTWVDSQGKIRLISNDHLCMYTSLPNGDRVLEDLKNGEVVRNLTFEKESKWRRQSLDKAKRQGKSIYCIDFNLHNHDSSEPIKGMRYYDLNTGRKYIIRTLDHIPFYLDLKSGQICDVVDENRVHNQDVQKIKDKYHELQKDTTLPSRRFFNAYWKEWDDIYYCGRD